MTLKEKVGQLFMLGIYSYDNEDDKAIVEKLIKEYHLGGFMFMQGSVKKQQELAIHYQNLSNIPLLFTQDIELGRVNRLNQELENFPDSLTVGAHKDENLAYELGRQIGKRTKMLNIHLDFAPVVDINNNPKNSIINNRSFGDNKENVAAKGIAVMKGMHDEGILACAKHFPGHGDTEIDSHLDFPTINKSRQELEKIELYPFRKMIENGAQAIMTAHIQFPQLDIAPATLSRKILTEILRKDLDFKGLIITDAINMKALAKFYTPEESALKALIAGNDIIIFAKAIQDTEIRFNEITSSIELIIKEVKKGTISEEEIDTHVLRILLAKQWLNLFESQPNTINIDLEKFLNINKKTYEQAITLVSNKKYLIPLSPLETYSMAYVQIGDSNLTFIKTLQESSDLTVYSLKSEAISDEINKLTQDLEKYEIIIIGLHEMSRMANQNWGIKQSTLNFLNLMKNKKIILIVFGNPYSLINFENIDTILLAYEESGQSAAAKIITGKIPSLGKLPVSVSKKFN